MGHLSLPQNSAGQIRRRYGKRYRGTGQTTGKGLIERDIKAKIPDPATRIVLYRGGGLSKRAGSRQPSEDGLHECALDGRRVSSLV